MKGYRTYIIIVLGLICAFILAVEFTIDLSKYSQFAKELTVLFKDLLPMIMSGLAIWKVIKPAPMKHENEN
jgi:hypothetical protein